MTVRIWLTIDNVVGDKLISQDKETIRIICADLKAFLKDSVKPMKTYFCDDGLTINWCR